MIVHELEKAFKAKNPFAARAAGVLDSSIDMSADAQAIMRERAQINATLATAFELRQLRFDLTEGLER